MRLNFKPGFTIHRKIAWLLLFSLGSLAVASGLIYGGSRNIEKTTLRINQTYEIIGILQQIITSVSESEAASYRLLAGDNQDANLKGDREATLKLDANHKQFERELDSLQRLTRKNGDQPKNAVLLGRLILEKKSFEDSLANAHASALRDIRKTDAGLHLGNLNDRVDALLSDMMHEERNLLATRKNLNESANRKITLIMIIGRIVGFLFIAVVLIQLNSDITRRRYVQEQLVKAILEAQEAKKMQEQFLANMSHEIRTPMNGIKGMTDLLLGTPLSEKQHELAGIIKSSVNNLLVIVNDILDFSKIKAGKLNIEKIDFDVREVINNAAAIFEHRLKKKGILLQTDIDPDIPNQLSGDPHRLYQVLVNLLGNALKFTHQGHIHVAVAVKQRLNEHIFLSFCISDTGVGIPSDSLPYIFDSFTQGGQDISRRYGGTGLGLTICKQLLHLQGGDISANSKPGNGSVFNFHIPYGYNEPALSEKPAAGAPSVGSIDDYNNLLAGKRFLVAEDNEINQKLIDYVLTRAGGTVELASNGTEAIKHLQNGKSFDLIIMDLQMPEMDGYAATQIIRNDLHMQTPIIAMTATAMQGEQLQCIRSGMNEYMTKPFEFADLYSRIDNLLSPEHSSQALHSRTHQLS